MAATPGPRPRTVIAGLLAAALLAACATPQDNVVEAHLLLVVPDNHVRAEGIECAGARPYRHVHAGAPFTVEAEDGTVLAEGQLPAGRAENADPSIDWGVPRFPTVCVMELTVPGLPEQPRYQLRLEEGSPLPFDTAGEAGEPVVVVVQ